MSEYRYTLNREWLEFPHGVVRQVTFVMLNPSTADALSDDATIRKCVGFAQRWGMSRIEVVNLWPLRATKPRDLFRASDLDGDVAVQSRWMTSAIATADVLVFAWGGNLDVAHRLGMSPAVSPVEIAAKYDIKPMCLGTTKSGQPRHPLMLSYGTPLEEWVGRDS